MQVQLNSLPSKILDQIPISIRLNKTALLLVDLPPNLQILLEQYMVFRPHPVVNLNTLDFSAQLGEYGDWFSIGSLRDVILEYIRNWFKVPIGSYPFDPTFGSNIKTYLHTNDTALREQLLQNEMRVIENLINNTYTSSFAVTYSTVVPKEFADHVEYRLEMGITLLNTPLTISINQ